MNPYMEKALTKYYSRRRRMLSILMWASLAAGILGVAGVLVIRPADGFRAPEFAAFELTALVLLVCAFLFWRLERPYLLEIFRTRPGDVRSLRRGNTSFQYRSGLIKVENEVATIFVELADGRALPLYFSGDLDEYNRLQKMIEKEIGA
jgi:hypothetical protein